MQIAVTIKCIEQGPHLPAYNITRIATKQQVGDRQREVWRFEYAELEHNHSLVEATSQTLEFSVAPEQTDFESLHAARTKLKRDGKSREELLDVHEVGGKVH